MLYTPKNSGFGFNKSIKHLLNTMLSFYATAAMHFNPFGTIGRMMFESSLQCLWHKMNIGTLLSPLIIIMDQSCFIQCMMEHFIMQIAYNCESNSLNGTSKE